MLEPDRLARSVQILGLDYAVITSVTRDDLPDGGAAVFAACIRAIRSKKPGCRVEALIADLGGNVEALATIVNAKPFALNHNIETVPRLYRKVRPKARYQRSLELIRRFKELDPGVLSKSGLMVGLGETRDEVFEVMADLRANGCDLLTVGQYLRPTPKHLPVARFWTPQEYEPIRRKGTELGFMHVEAGPFVRSSYHADEQIARATGSRRDRAAGG